MKPRNPDPAPGATRVLALESCWCAQVFASAGWITMRRTLSLEAAERYLGERQGETPKDVRG